MRQETTFFPVTGRIALVTIEIDSFRTEGRMAKGRATFELDREEIVQRIHRGALARCNMRGEELLAAYGKGLLEEAGEIADLLVLADLLADDDQILNLV